MSEYNVNPVQTTAGWTTEISWPENLKGTAGTKIAKGTPVTFTYDKDTGVVTASVNLAVESGN